MKGISNKLIMASVAVFLMFVVQPVLGLTMPAPEFSIKSGDGKFLAKKDLSNKVVVIYYETRDTHHKSDPLKRALAQWGAKLPAAQRARIVHLSVIDCSSAVFGGIWRRKLRQNSKKIGRTIYGDWDGKMRSAFGFKKNESNICLIDPKGVIRLKLAGRLDQKGIDTVKRWLSILLAGK